MVPTACRAPRHHRSYLEKIFIDIRSDYFFHLTAEIIFFVSLSKSSRDDSFMMVKSAMAMGPPLLVFSSSAISRLIASSPVRGRTFLLPSLPSPAFGGAPP